MTPAATLPVLARGCAGALLLVVLLAPTPARSEAPASEYALKAAFLYNFAKFVDWPPTSFDATKGRLVFGIYGVDPFEGALDRIASAELVHGRRIEVRRATRLADLGPCHVLFVKPAVSAAADDIISAASARGRLLVGDDVDFAERGGAIGFFIEERRVRFAVNLGATERAGLTVSSKLLKLARIIRN